MNKKEFIKVFAEKQEISQVTASDILDSVKDIIKSETISGNEVSLGTDFGTFKPTRRTGVIPGTSKTYDSNSVKFSVSAPFKKALN